jgi:hypothetical protein
MTTAAVEKGYRPTESKYKGGAHEMYVTYDWSRPSSWWRFGTGAEAPLKAAALVKGDRRSMRW